MTTNTRFNSSGLFDSCGRLISTLPATVIAEQQQSAQRLTQVVETENTGSLPTGDSVAPEIPVAAVVRSRVPLDVTNADFVKAVFGTLPAGISAAVCTKYGDPTVGGWHAMKAGNVDLQCLSNWNNYVNCSSFYEDEYGNVHARKDKFHALHFILLDDMGTKVPWAQLGDFKPSFVIETSPGNYQAAIILEMPLIDIGEATQLVDAVIAKGLSDRGATGVARWARSPKGINGKPKYKSESGEPFQCRLVRWNPERRYTVEKTVTGLDLDMGVNKTPRHHVASDAARPTPVASQEKSVNPDDFAKLHGLVYSISPDCPRAPWMNVVMAVHHTTGGSDAGLALVDAWSSQCKERYKGSKDVEVQWRSLDGHKGPFITIGTLIKMASDAGADVRAIVQSAIESVSTAGIVPLTQGNPLVRFSLSDSLPELEKQRVEQRLILGEIVLLGQATVLYALANTGKTLILIYLIIESIKKGLIDPSKLFYVNMDDNSSGLVDKVRLSVEYGFHMLADGHRGFAAKNFRMAMEKMTETNTASGAIVVIDTLKKFVNTMNKEQSADFTRVVRQFSLKGGTVIALSHANKNPGPDGKIKYTGTTDIVDDFDCAYTLQTIGSQTDTNLKVVEFNNIKRRGDVAETAAYSYSTERGLSYTELLTSVQEVHPDQVGQLKQAVELQSDAAVIATIEACIADGINTKMRMTDAGSKLAGVSTRAVLRVIEKYTGEDAQLHRWRYVVRARGAQVYELLQRPAAPMSELTPLAPVPPTLQQANAVPEFSDVTVSPEVDQTLAFHAAILEESTQLSGGGEMGSGVDIADTY